MRLERGLLGSDCGKKVIVKPPNEHVTLRVDAFAPRHTRTVEACLSLQHIHQRL
jgi:hypothetical protein